ncbi:MAG: glycoside hydrolase family 3 protein, partial [Bacteroidaceae bacterium]|nr:glycoside hydrolase family 3 protein [Bacteroidaceae bacterium]
MKKFVSVMWTLVLTAAACTSGGGQGGQSPYESRIDSVLQRMSLDEKVGQMCELTIETIGEMKNDSFVIDYEKLQTVIGQYKVGSILNAPTHGLSREDWKRIIDAIQEISMREIGIPCIYGLDQNHGTTYTLGGTLFPQPINLAASFNPALATEGAKICAYETRASNCPWVYNPTMDVMSDPRWSRIWESFGEDPLLNATMARAQVVGYQGDDAEHIGENSVAVCIKHYLGYGYARTGKDRTPAYITPRDLREKCFEPFRQCVEQKALSLMVNSASINGVPVHANRELLTGWLKEQMQWDGMIVTDWADINNLYQREHVAANKKEAIALAINAGIDMSMEPYDLQFCTLLKEAVEEGLVPMSRIDDAVRRVLRLKFRLGLFETPITDLRDYPLFGGEQHAQVALKTARECEILLKNEGGILPLAEGKRILVTGPNANQMRCLNGGWSYSWQG